jgi:DNA-binding NtrC family response regulator
VTRILLVEDDECFRGLISEVLTRAGFDVIEAGDGADALELIGGSLLGEGPQIPDVVITDVKMPHLTGLHVLAALRHVRPRIPTILTTAFPDAATVALAHKLGAMRIFEKPFDVALLPVEIARCLAARDAEARSGPGEGALCLDPAFAGRPPYA